MQISNFIEPLESRRLLSGAGLTSAWVAAGAEPPPLRRALTGVHAAHTLRAGASDPSFGFEGEDPFRAEQIFALADGSGIVTRFNGAVIRYDSTGTEDVNFGDATDPTASDLGYADTIAALQPDGTFLKVGVMGVNSESHLFLQSIARDGSLGSPLILTGSPGRIGGCMIQADGKILVASTVSFDPLAYFVITRYGPDGAVDTTYASGGQLVFNETAQNVNDVYLDAALQPNGKLLVVTARDNPDIDKPGPSQVLRFNSDGTPDLTFGKNGVLAGIRSSAASIAVQSDGKLLWSTVRTDGSADVVQRFLPSGAPDLSFGEHGRAYVAPRTHWRLNATKVAAGPDGHVFVAMLSLGSFVAISYRPGGQYTNETIGVARLSHAGTLDQSFGHAGTTWVQPYQDYGNDFGAGSSIALAVQPDGKPVIGNYSGMTRLLSEPEPTFTVHHGTRLTIYATSGTDQLALDNANGHALRVTFNGQTRLFDSVPNLYGSGGIKEIEVVWPGHPTLRHLQAPLSGTIQQIEEATAAKHPKS